MSEARELWTSAEIAAVDPTMTISSGESRVSSVITMAGTAVGVASSTGTPRYPAAAAALSASG